MTRAIFGGVLLLFALGGPLPLSANTEVSDRITRTGSVDDDYYAAGGRIELDAEVAGDVVVAGGELEIGGRIAGDLIAAGGRIDVEAAIADDLRLAGGELRLSIEAGDDLAASGGRIEITSTSTVGGNAWLSGGEILVAGRIAGDLAVYGGKLVMAARVDGDVEIDADQVEWRDGASVGGNLDYRGAESLPAGAAATVDGAISEQRADRQYADGGFGLFFSIALLAAGIALYLLFPHYIAAATRRIGSDPLTCLGLGFLFLVATPFVALFMMLIVLGFWIGLALLALYGVALLAGFLLGCFYLGETGAGWLRQPVTTTGRRLISLAVVLFALGLVQAIPLLGGILLLLLLLFGLGAGIVQLRYVYRPVETSP